MEFLGEKEPKPRGIMSVDWDNLVIGLDPDEINEASITGGFDRLVKKITRKFGKIVEVFVFLPPQAAYIWSETIYRMGYWPIVCPKIESKEKTKELDTVDESLARLSSRMIDNIKNISFFVLVSGDWDFSLLVREGIRGGLKIIVVASSLRSLSGKLVPPLSDQVYIFELAKPK